MIGSFIFGALVGATAMYFYGRQIRDYVGEKTQGARAKAADTLHAAADSLQSGDTPRTTTGGESGRRSG